MNGYIFFPLIGATALSWLFVFLIKIFSARYSVVRHEKHAMGRRNIPLLGGVAVFFSFVVVAFSYPGLVITGAIAAFIAGALLLVVVGIADDMKPLGWQSQLAVQITAALLVVFSGISVEYINNPFGGTIRLDTIHIPITDGFAISFLGALFIIVWLVFFANAFNWLDGTDGLAGSIGLVAALTLAVLSLRPEVMQPPVAILSSALAGCLAGFLVWNLPPARIYLGGSSAAIGFVLGAIAIFAGAKVATAVLVFTLPFLDAIWVIAQRLINRRSIFKKDQAHIHHRLVRRGWKPGRILFVLSAITCSAGILAVALSGIAKSAAILVFIAVISGLFALLERKK